MPLITFGELVFRSDYQPEAASREASSASIDDVEHDVIDTRVATIGLANTGVDSNGVNGVVVSTDAEDVSGENKEDFEDYSGEVLESESLFIPISTPLSTSSSNTSSGSDSTLEPTQSGPPNQVDQFTRAKPLSLLSYLTLEGEQHRSFMAQLIWGNAKKPPNSLSQAIDQLVRFLPGVIEKTDTRVKAMVSSDAATFREHMHHNRYLEAIELYKGDFLQNSFPSNTTFDFEDWYIQNSNHFAEQAQLALCEQARLDLVANPIRAKEFSERAYKIYERTQVGDSTLQLLHALLVQQNSIFAPKVAKVLEEYGLSATAVKIDLAVVEEEVTILKAVEEAKAKGIEPPKILTRNIPRYTREFFGRAEEFQFIHQMLLQGDSSLVSLVAQGGMGKTRLSVELAKACLTSGQFDTARFDTVSFTALEPLNSPDQIPRAIADTYSLTLDPSSDVTESAAQVANYLKDKRHLLVLDNFEHLLASEHLAQSQQVINQILDACPDMRMLVTTRQNLNIDHEWVVDIKPLGIPKTDDGYQKAFIAVRDLDATYASDNASDRDEAKDVVAKSSRFENATNLEKDKKTEESKDDEALKLFVNRAKHANLRFQLDDDNRDSVKRLIQLTGGLPLAIELAAVWIQSLTPAAIVEVLEQDLDILSDPNKEEKHQSIKTTFEFSWQRLSEAEQNYIQKLSVFEGGFQKDAATFVTGINYMQLLQLIQKAMLYNNDETRFFIHPLLQQFLAEKLEASGAAFEVKAAHAKYYSDYFGSVATDFRTAKEGKALDAVELEIDNIKQAWLFACEQGFVDGAENDFEINQVESRLIWELRRFFDARTQQGSGAKFFNELADMDTARKQPECYAQVLAAEAWLLFKMSRMDEAKRLAEQAYSLLKESDDVSAKLNVVNTVGAVASRSGEHEESLAYFTEAVKLAKQEEGQHRLATYLTNLSVAQRYVGYLDSARNSLLDALKLVEEKSSDSERCLILLNLDAIYSQKGDYAQAKMVCEEAIRIAEANRFEQHLPILYSNYADTLFYLGDIDNSQFFCLKALEMVSGEVHIATIASVYDTQAKILFAKDEYDKAKAKCRECIEIATTHNIIRNAVRVLPIYAQILLKEKDFKAAIEVLYVVLEYSQDIKITKNAARNVVKENNLKIEEFQSNKSLTVGDVLQNILKDTQIRR